jgi:hypothetical protein
MKEPQAFYHVAGIGHWREIVTEQLSLLAKAKFKGVINVGFLGLQYEDGFIENVASCLGLNVNVRWFGDNLQMFEIPTQRWMQETCHSLDSETPILYFHTKGVSRNSWMDTMWRWLMNAYCLTKWDEMVSSLEIHNCAGVSLIGNYFPSSTFPGNFWWTTAGFVSHLTQVDEYQSQFVECISRNNPFSLQKRHSAETWISCKLNLDPCVFGPHDNNLWSHDFWNSPKNDIWREIAIKFGSVSGLASNIERPRNFLEAFAPHAHLSCRFGSDKVSVHKYNNMYDVELSSFIGKEIRFLEIGVCSGWSLDGWRKFFGDKAKITGLDISTDWVVFDEEEILVCDATDPISLKILEGRGEWDIVVDDGSHKLEDQIKTFELLWPKVASGGVFVIEDIQNMNSFCYHFPEAVIYDTRNLSGRSDDVCAVFRKP